MAVRIGERDYRVRPERLDDKRNRIAGNGYPRLLALHCGGAKKQRQEQ